MLRDLNQLKLKLNHKIKSQIKTKITKNLVTN